MTAKKPPAKKAAKKSHGRPSSYSPAVGKVICEKLALGNSLRAICQESGMPPESTVRTWVVDDVQGFSAQYARAREMGFDAIAEQALEIADTPLEGVESTTKDDGRIEEKRGDMLGHRKLQVDARKWLLAKWAPKKYGEKLAIGGDADAPPIRTESTVTLTPEDAYKKMLGQ